MILVAPFSKLLSSIYMTHIVTDFYSHKTLTLILFFDSFNELSKLWTKFLYNNKWWKISRSLIMLGKTFYINKGLEI